MSADSSVSLEAVRSRRIATMCTLSLALSGLLLTPTGTRAQERSESTSAPTMDEVLITAQKREERIQDVPVPVSVVDTSRLEENNQSRLRDYFSQVPGMSLSASFGGGTQEIAIRGITTSGSTNPTIGMTIDDVPFGSSTNLGNGERLFPDIDPSDLERIEVLRGPQGALYGASSMGGLIKFVTKDPSTDSLQARVQVTGSHVEDGEGGYAARGSVNVPVNEQLALRLSGFTRRDPGYIDNVVTGQNDVNRANAKGGRASVLWRPSDMLSIKLGALLQDVNGDGTPAVDADMGLKPTLGDLKQARLLGTEQWTSKVRQYTGTLTANLGFAQFTSISGYGSTKYFQLADDSSQSLGYGYFSGSLYGTPGASFENLFETRKFTEEFRLTSLKSQKFDWLLGGFYTHEDTPADQHARAVDPASGSVVGDLIDFDFPSSLSEYAMFADATYHFNDVFDIQIGGRESWIRQTYDETDIGPLVPIFYFNLASPLVNPTERTNDSAFTYLFTPRLRLSSDLMMYARFSSGYRAGGPNVSAVVQNTPTQYRPDKTNNYDLGLKGDALDHKLTFDVAAFYIDWKRIQLSFLENAAVFVGNGGGAKSQGLELSVQARPWTGAAVALATAFTDAKLTEDLAAPIRAVGLSGDRLPYSARFTGNLSVDQEFALVSHWNGFAGASVGYVGDRFGQFNTNKQPRLRYPSYSEIDARTGVRSDVWTITLFANNLGNKRGIVGGVASAAQSNFDAIYIQPRTIGVSVIANLK
jgi:iron complex outermembrane recepter protein